MWMLEKPPFFEFNDMNPGNPFAKDVIAPYVSDKRIQLSAKLIRYQVQCIQGSLTWSQWP